VIGRCVGDARAETELDRLYTITLDATGAHLEMTIYAP
jgi:hypothetical protein